MTERKDAVTLRLSGEKAENGIELVDLERFVRNFVGALRGFDRVRRVKPPVRGGHPKRRDEEVAAFKVVGLEPGSTVLTLEPARLEAVRDQASFEPDASSALENIHSLALSMSGQGDVDADVAEALERARTTLGSDAGAIEIALPNRLSAPTVRIDREAIERIRAERTEQRPVSRVSGRLHLIDLEPDRIGVRSPQGIDWTCEFPSPLEERVKSLIDQIVVVEGAGEQRTVRSGSMEITSIAPAYTHEQPAFSSGEPADGPDELMRSQAITGPQGLAALGDADWEDDEQGARFMEYVLGRS